ncbi:MAG: hypothetical protein ICCCNLDF_01261 [Planctomycetes bacterium]|nr:hypothetical protein [Planctomycetota bacterium]
MLPVEIRSSAFDEAEEAHEYLQHQQDGLGWRFTEMLNLTIRRIGAFPESSAEMYRGIRCALVPKFRYRVFYRVESTRVVVLAVRHPSREQPDWSSLG